MRKKDDFYDDGRTIADMDVDGMPFHDRKPKSFNTVGNDENEKPIMTAKEQRQVIFSGMLAGAVIALIFIAAAAVLISILVFAS